MGVARRLFLIIVVVSFIGCCAINGFAESYCSNYPGAFDGRGVIDGISEKSIVVDDIPLELTPETRFNRPSLPNCSKRGFKKGKYVIYILDPENRNHVKSLWLLNKQDDCPEKP